MATQLSQKAWKTLAEELLTLVAAREQRFGFFKSMFSGRLTLLQWMAPHSCVCGSTNRLNSHKNKYEI